MMENIKRLNEMTGAGLLDCKKALIASDGDFEKALAYLKERGIAKAIKKESRIAAEGLVALALNDKEAVLVEVNSETDFVAKNALFVEFVQRTADLVLASGVKSVEELLAVAYEGDTFNAYLIALIARIGEKLSIRRIARLARTKDQVFGAYVHGGKIGAITLVEGGEDVAKDMAMQVASCDPSYITYDQIPADKVAKEEAEQLAALRNDEAMSAKPEAMLVKIAQGKTKKVLADSVLAEQDYIKDPAMKVSAYLAANKAKVVSLVRFKVGEGMEKRSDDFAAEVLRQAK